MYPGSVVYIYIYIYTPVGMELCSISFAWLTKCGVVHMYTLLIGELSLKKLVKMTCLDRIPTLTFYYS